MQRVTLTPEELFCVKVAIRVQPVVCHGLRILRGQRLVLQVLSAPRLGAHHLATSVNPGNNVDIVLRWSLPLMRPPPRLLECKPLAVCST